MHAYRDRGSMEFWGGRILVYLFHLPFAIIQLVLVDEPDPKIKLLLEVKHTNLLTENPLILL